MTLEAQLKDHIREVPDFPINGVNFKDITPIFLNPRLVEEAAVALAAIWKDQGVNKVIGIDSRGFLLGPQIARELDAGFVLVRKKGKLPPETVSVSYNLEYGQASLESVKTALNPGDRVIVHDDLLATGGTARAAAQLARQLGAEVLGFSFLVHLAFLPGADKLDGQGLVHTLVKYEE